MNRKLIIALILFVAVAAGFAMYLSQKSKEPEQPVVQNEVQLVPTDNWKTCRNDEYGWEIKYPAEWFVYGEGSRGKDTPIIQRETECIGSDVSISSFTPKEFTKYPSKSIGLGFHVSNQERLSTTIYAGSKSLDEYFGKNPKILEAHSIVKETIILGERAVWLQEKNEIESTKPRLMFFHNEKLFEIFGTNTSPELFDELLLTFKFLD